MPAVPSQTTFALVGCDATAGIPFMTKATVMESVVLGYCNNPLTYPSHQKKGADSPFI